MTLTFMGLYGVDAPVPDFISEKTLAEVTASGSLRDFLDIFNHRLYGFFYRSWERLRPEVKDDDARGIRRYLSVAGLEAAPEFAARSSRAMALLSLAGLMAPRARGAAGLRTLISSILDLPVRIEENVARWVQLGGRKKLGQGLRLDHSSTLGNRMFDVSGKFRIWLGPMDLDRYLSQLPGGEGADELRWIVRTYAGESLDYDVALQLHTKEMPRARLADSTCRLGLTACLGRPLTEVMTRIVTSAASAPHAPTHREAAAA